MIERRGILRLAMVVFAACASSAFAGPPQWELKYTENFDGKELNRKLWRRIEGNPDSGADWQRNISPRPDLSEVKGGELLLKGIRNDDVATDSRSVLAGGVSTQGLFAMKYGKVEIRARLEGQKGAWPAIWMMPQNPVGTWPTCGEIDIIERLNFDDFVYHTVHSAWTGSHPKDPPHMVKGEIKANGWNIYALEWTPERLVWRVNGKMTHSYRKVGDSHERWPWDVPFYLMIDMQLGGNWVGSVDESTLPVVMRIDWVKFYQLKVDGKRVSLFTRPK
jgi:hypothetical protein